MADQTPAPVQVSAPLAITAADVARNIVLFQHGSFPLDQVAEMTGISQRRLELACREGKVQHVQVGRFRRMTLAQIDLLMAAHRTGTTEGPVEDADDDRRAIQSSLQAASRRTPGRAA